MEYNIRVAFTDDCSSHYSGRTGRTFEFVHSGAYPTSEDIARGIVSRLDEGVTITHPKLRSLKINEIPVHNLFPRKSIEDRLVI